MRRRYEPLLLASLIAGACAGHAPVRSSGSVTMPDPGGCYVLVYDQPQLRGTRQYLNGPMRFLQLSELPHRTNWQHRIRSLRVGPLASTTVWANAALRGASQRLGPNEVQPMLPPALRDHVESLEISCQPVAATH